MKQLQYIQGRGAQLNPQNKFLKNNYTYEHLEGIDAWELDKKKRPCFDGNAKTIVNEIKSEEMLIAFSLNSYHGFEHGCEYCLAPKSLEYYGCSAGTDFEQKIVVKHNAPKRLEELFQSKKWNGAPISLSGNTDGYQPIERTKKITRQLLKLCLKYKNPIGIITKNKLVLRDIDIIQELNKNKLVSVFASITSTDEKLRAKLEPRSSTYASRFEIIKELARHNIPVGVMNAPIIPGLNDHSMYEVLRQSSLNGAQYAGYTINSLNGAISDIFNDWIKQANPLTSSKVLAQMKGAHYSKLNDSQINIGMYGQGPGAQIINQQFKKYCSQFGLNKEQFHYNTTSFIRQGQLSLF